MQRIVTQVVMFGVNIVSKAFMQAYQTAKAGGGAASQAANKAAIIGKMPIDQARQILGVEAAAKAGTLTREQVMEQFTRHYDANDVEKGGSFYIQSKIWNAKEALLEDMKKKPNNAQPVATRVDKKTEPRPSASAGASFSGTTGPAFYYPGFSSSSTAVRSVVGDRLTSTSTRWNSGAGGSSSLLPGASRSSSQYGRDVPLLELR